MNADPAGGDFVRSAHRRRSIFESQIPLRPVGGSHILLLTHVLADSREYISAAQRLGSVLCVIAIPYSRNGDVVTELRERGVCVLTPTLSELREPRYIWTAVEPMLPIDGSLVVAEIGGYFAEVCTWLSTRLGPRFAGVVEDTAAGLRRYEKIQSHLPCPVLSVARSSLKEAEDVLVGESCLQATEAILRQMGEYIRGRRVLVLGYGRVGRGLARALASRGCDVYVYDVDPVKCVVAVGEGMAVASKATALRSADIVFGATGQQSLSAAELRDAADGAVFVSCSSRDVEFDLEGFHLETSIGVGRHLQLCEVFGRRLLLVNGGKPVNFTTQVAIGPQLSLVQTEMLLGVDALLSGEYRQPGIYELSDRLRERVAYEWLRVNTSPETGRILWN